jgi:hypothetical protein
MLIIKLKKSRVKPSIKKCSSSKFRTSIEARWKIAIILLVFDQISWNFNWRLLNTYSINLLNRVFYVLFQEISFKTCQSLSKNCKNVGCFFLQNRWYLREFLIFFHENWDSKGQRYSESGYLMEVLRLA